MVFIASSIDCRGKVVWCFGASVAALRAAGFAGRAFAHSFLFGLFGVASRWQKVYHYIVYFVADVGASWFYIGLKAQGDWDLGGILVIARACGRIL